MLSLNSFKQDKLRWSSTLQKFIFFQKNISWDSFDVMLKEFTTWKAKQIQDEGNYIKVVSSSGKVKSIKCISVKYMNLAMTSKCINSIKSFINIIEGGASMTLVWRGFKQHTHFLWSLLSRFAYSLRLFVR